MADDSKDLPDPPAPEKKAPTQPKNTSKSTPPAMSAQDLIASGHRAYEILQQISNSPAVQMGREFTRKMQQTQVAINRFVPSVPDIPSLIGIDPRAEPWASIRALREQWEEGTRSIRELRTSPTVQLMQETLESYRALRSSPATEILEELRAQHAEVNRRLEELSPVIASLRAAVAQAAESPAYLEYLESSFAGELLGRLDEVDIAPSPEAKTQISSDLLIWLFNEIQQKLIEHPASHAIIIHALVPLLWAIIGGYVGVVIGEAGAQQHSDEMNRRFDQIEQHLKAHAEANAERRTQYAATKVVLVHAEPSAPSKIIAVLPAQTLIEEIDRQGQWLHIEYFNFIDGELNQGWIYKRHLVLVESSAEK